MTWTRLSYLAKISPCIIHNKVYTVKDGHLTPSQSKDKISISGRSHSSCAWSWPKERSLAHVITLIEGHTNIQARLKSDIRLLHLYWHPATDNYRIFVFNLKLERSRKPCVLSLVNLSENVIPILASLSLITCLLDLTWKDMSKITRFGSRLFSRYNLYVVFPCNNKIGKSLSAVSRKEVSTEPENGYGQDCIPTLSKRMYLLGEYLECLGKNNFNLKEGALTGFLCFKFYVIITCWCFSILFLCKKIFVRLRFLVESSLPLGTAKWGTQKDDCYIFYK